jgi:hypothetical protein
VGGKLGEIDSSKMGFGVSVVSLCGLVDSNSSRANLIRSCSIGVTPARRFELYSHSSVGASRSKGGHRGLGAGSRLRSRVRKSQAQTCEEGSSRPPQLLSKPNTLPCSSKPLM